MLQINQLQISLAQRALLAPLSLTLQGGEFATLMGPSGCGKSSLLGAIAGTLSAPLSMRGTILLDNQNIETLAQAKRRVGMIFQDDLLFPHFNVAQNLAFSLPRDARSQSNELIAKALEQAELDGYQTRAIHSLSGGQRARVAVLRALLAKPRLLLLDEPFSKLDKALRQQFRQFVIAQLKVMNIPAILVTHDESDIIGQAIMLKSEGA